MMDQGTYKRLLLKISQNMTEVELKSLKFLLDDGTIPKARLEEFETATDVFSELEKRDQLSADNLTYLRDKLKVVSEGRVNLIRLIDNTMPQNRTVPFDNRQSFDSRREEPAVVGLHKEFDYLSKHLGRQWKQMCRNLPGVTEQSFDEACEKSPGHLKEQIIYVLNEWATNNRTSDKKPLIMACRKAELNLYADELEEMRP